MRRTKKRARNIKFQLMVYIFSRSAKTMIPEIVLELRKIPGYAKVTESDVRGLFRSFKGRNAFRKQFAQSSRGG